jgi:hypothetical protein
MASPTAAGSQGGGGGGGLSDGAAPPPLVGSLGQEYVQAALSTGEVIDSIADIQARGALPDAAAPPLLALLDALGLSRAEAHRAATAAAVAELLERVPRLPPGRQLALLEATFPFLGISDLRAVPLALLDALHPAVPAAFMRQLAVDRRLFWELPPGVQRQAWELDRKLLQAHALPAVAAYAQETATAMQGLDMGAPLGGEEEAEAEEGARPRRLPRRALRAGSPSLRRLAAMVGPSPTLRRGVAELVVARFRESEAPFVGPREAALAALRGQLLLALQDAGEAGACAGDPALKLARTLDTCLAEGGVSEDRLAELLALLKPFDELLAAAPKRGAAAPRARGRAAGRRDDADAESAGAPGGAGGGADPLAPLGDAGMALRDPAAFHLLLAAAVARLGRCVAERLVPAADEPLSTLVRLLMLAVGARHMLRAGEFYFPDPLAHKNSEGDSYCEALNNTLPMLAEIRVDSALRALGGAPDDAPDAPPPDDLPFVMVRDELSRHVAQAFALERLAAGDAPAARRALAALAAALDRLRMTAAGAGDAAAPEFAPFAFALARRLAAMLAAGAAPPSSALWRLAVDGLLVRLAGAKEEVHEEVLRLLLAAAPAMDPARLAAAAAACLAASARLRSAARRKRARGAALPPHPMGGGVAWGGDGGGGAAAAAGDGDLPSPTAPAARGVDGVRALYARLPAAQPELTPAVAPALFAYLARGE